jgi:hypothetical protein
MGTILLADLMVEIEKLAVEKQSDLLNKVKLMEAKQERDELVRRFVASDTCNETVSHVNTTILMALVKGLVIDDTKGEVLSKMEKFDLDETVTFVEARETGQRSLLVLYIINSIPLLD